MNRKSTIRELKPESSVAGNSSTANPQLLEENRSLQLKVTELERELRSRKEREQTLANAINLGFWEWDEIADRPGYLSEQ
jgi:hypothetical protein